MVSRYRLPYCIVLVKPFVCLHEVENPLPEVIKHADLHCMEDVGLREVAHDTGNMLKHVESLVNTVRPVFGISCLGGGIGERSI